MQTSANCLFVFQFKMKVLKHHLNGSNWKEMCCYLNTKVIRSLMIRPNHIAYLPAQSSLTGRSQASAHIGSSKDTTKVAV